MKKDVEVKKDNAVSAEQKEKRGFEGGVSQEDLILPRATLIQPLSPEMQEELEGVRPGVIINSLTKKTLPAEFIPIFLFKNWVRFNPRNSDDPGYVSIVEPGKMIWRSSDPNDPRVIAESKFGSNGEQPLATSFLNFFSFFPGEDMPIILSFSKTSFKTGKQLLSLSKFATGDMFSRKYKLGSKLVQNAKGSYHIFTVTPAGKVDDESFKVCETFWKDFSPKSSAIIVHDEVENGEPDNEERPY